MDETPNSSTQRVLVSYTAPPIFLASPNWKKVHAALLGQLPLRNIHWKSAKGAVKTIQDLDINLVPFESLRDEHASQIPVTLLEKPLLHVYIVHCEVNYPWQRLFQSNSKFIRITIWKHTGIR